MMKWLLFAAVASLAVAHGMNVKKLEETDGSEGDGYYRYGYRDRLYGPDTFHYRYGYRGPLHGRGGGGGGAIHFDVEDSADGVQPMEVPMFEPATPLVPEPKSTIPTSSAFEGVTDAQQPSVEHVEPAVEAQDTLLVDDEGAVFRGGWGRGWGRGGWGGGWGGRGIWGGRGFYGGGWGGGLYPGIGYGYGYPAYGYGGGYPIYGGVYYGGGYPGFWGGGLWGGRGWGGGWRGGWGGGWRGGRRWGRF